MSITWQERLDAMVASHASEVVDLRRRLHAHPEPSGEELETSLLIYRRLSEAGLQVRIGPDGCGVLVERATPSSPPCPLVAVRGDIDALWIQDEKLAPYRSTRDGVMHACGHDAHTAILTGVCLALHALEAAGGLPWPLAWRGIFQPSEETALGARRMIEWGALEGVAAIFALHVEPTRPPGTIAIRPGAMSAHCDTLEFAIRGQGGHGARPHESKDPIAAAASLISSLYQFVSRATDSLEAVVVTIGHVSAGQNPNVIPETALLRGTLRTLQGKVRQQTLEHIRRITKGVADVTGTEIDFEFGSSIPSVFNDLQMTELIERAGAEVVGGAGVVRIEQPSMGSEDFACYLTDVPGAMFRLGVAKDLAAVTPLHSPRFDIDEAALAIGVRILTRAVVEACRPGSTVSPRT